MEKKSTPVLLMLQASDSFRFAVDVSVQPEAAYPGAFDEKTKGNLNHGLLLPESHQPFHSAAVLHHRHGNSGQDLEETAG